MRQYISIGRQWLLRIGIFLLIAVMLLTTGIMIALGAMNGYTLTTSETYQYAFETITYDKTHEMISEWRRKYDYKVDEYNLSPDFRGKTHFKCVILDPEGNVLYSTLPDGGKTYTSEQVMEETACSVSVFEHGNERWYEWYSYSGEPQYNTDTLLFTIYGYYGYTSQTFDLYQFASGLILTFHPLRYLFPVILLAGLVLLALLWYRMSVHTGHRQYLPDHPQYTGETVLSFFDRIPYDLYMLILTGLFILCIVLLSVLYDLVEMNLVYLGVWAFVGLVSLMIVLLMAAYITTVSRVKAKNLLKNTLVWRCCLLLWRVMKLVWRIWLRCWGIIRRPFVKLGKICTAIPLFWQAALIAPVILIFYGLFSSLMWESFGVFLLWILVSVILYLGILYCAYSFRVLMKSGEALAGGNLRYKTDTKNLLMAFRSHGENLNRIGEGMEKALSEKIKSERFKTELITNVSHDIKTPLTSIINYTDLLSKEPLEGNAKEYTEVIMRHSARLKKLIEDLIEASKASTGNIAVALERLDVCQIVRQSIGEYEERLEARGLRVVQTVPEEEIYASVDGRQLWRVLDNLYSNVCKYALEGTRVYVVVCAMEGEVTVSVKNISRDVLSAEADELTERFVQGDSSRASEGSGLGLNIAKSLTELQGGRFAIHCDGDLFRVDVSFPVVE